MQPTLKGGIQVIVIGYILMTAAVGGCQFTHQVVFLQDNYPPISLVSRHWSLVSPFLVSLQHLFMSPLLILQSSKVLGLLGAQQIGLFRTRAIWNQAPKISLTDLIACACCYSVSFCG